MSPESDTVTRAFLLAHGLEVSPADLAAAVEEAVRRLPAALYRAEGARDLSEGEAAALEEAGLDLETRDRGRADPLARTVAEYAALLRKSLSTAQTAARLGVAPSRIRQRLTSRPPTLYGIRLRSRWRMPLFQFTRGGLVPGMEEVVARLDPALHPVAIFRWFTTPNPDLVAEGAAAGPLSPRDWLRLGLPPAAVAELAASL